VPLSQLNVNVNAKGIQRTKDIGQRGETAQTARRRFVVSSYHTLNRVVSSTPSADRRRRMHDDDDDDDDVKRQASPPTTDSVIGQTIHIYDVTNDSKPRTVSREKMG
jgi:hypothetical protein